MKLNKKQIQLKEDENSFLYFSHAIKILGGEGELYKAWKQRKMFRASYQIRGKTVTLKQTPRGLSLESSSNSVINKLSEKL